MKSTPLILLFAAIATSTSATTTNSASQVSDDGGAFACATPDCSHRVAIGRAVVDYHDMGKMAVVPDGTVLSFANDTLPSFHEASTVANAAVLDSSDALTHYKRHFGVELNLFKRKSKNCDFNNGRTLHPHTEGNCQEAILGKGVDRPINGWHNCKQRGGKHFFCCITELQKKKTRELVDGEDESERAEVEGGDLLARGGKATVSVTECKCYSISSSAVKGRHGGECYK